MNLKVKIKKLGNEAILPTYSTKGSAYMDITATSKQVVDGKNYGFVEYGTQLAFEVPEGYFLDVRPRSSISNTGMILRNGCGVLDNDYRGELKLRFLSIPDTVQYEIGERIGQIALLPLPKIEWEEVTELETTERNDGGFGSTNK
jgi:dUTP pyrophosphatase